MINLLLFVLLLALTSFFVATEFAIIRMRASRVQQMVDEGTKNAKAVQEVTTHLDGYLSACQLGITITALGLGWLGEPTMEKLLHPLFAAIGLAEGGAHSLVSFITAFVLVTYLHVVFGELAPKTVAIHQSERISQLTAPYLIVFNKAMYPFIWLLNGSANKLVRLFGLHPASEHEAHSEEEIRLILSESYESGKINHSEFGYVNRIFEFDERLAREIMVPRTDMECLYVDRSHEDNIAIMKREQYTRYPVAKGDKDHIIGLLNTKQLFLSGQKDGPPDMRKLLQPAMTVPDVIPIGELLRIMQLERVHMVVLLDEYGGTSGLLTIEDIVEEIVGDIRDEFDTDETKEIEKLKPMHYLVDGRALINDVNDVTGLQLQSDDVDTIGGWLYQRQPGLPEGEAWRHHGAEFVIRSREEHRIRRIELFTDSEEHEINAFGHA